MAASARPALMDSATWAGRSTVEVAVVHRLLRDVADGFWSGVDYLWFCRWMP